MVIQCKQKEHGELSCEEEKARQVREASAEMGLLIQSCPFCGEPGDFSEDQCLHITCRRCDEQYCFLCATSHTPTVQHANYFHRPQCSFFNIECCDDKCMINGAALCAKAQFLPGPCATCKGNTKLHNKCTHVAGSTWKACSTCVMDRKQNCTHWCHECSRSGKLCTRPGDFSPADIAKNCHLIEHTVAIEVEAKRKAARK